MILRWLRELKNGGLPPISVLPERRVEVEKAIERDGRWEKHIEWRISTVTSMSIERTGESGYRKYRVRVECDYVFEAQCPTLSRATEIAYMYEQLMPRLWHTYGWASWATRSRLEPHPDER
jgi:hypothetical protein